MQFVKWLPYNSHAKIEFYPCLCGGHCTKCYVVKKKRKNGINFHYRCKAAASGVSIDLHIHSMEVLITETNDVTNSGYWVIYRLKLCLYAYSEMVKKKLINQYTACTRSDFPITVHHAPGAIKLTWKTQWSQKFDLRKLSLYRVDVYRELKIDQIDNTLNEKRAAAITGARWERESTR